jgi:hypothetical protein
VRCFIVGTLAFAALVGGCGSDEPPRPCERNNVPLLTATSGTTPRFDWSPGCLAYRLTVLGPGGAVVWQVQGDAGNTMGSGIRYGVVPAGATESQAAAAIVSGQPHQVGLFFYTGNPAPNDAELLTAIQFFP